MKILELNVANHEVTERDVAVLGYICRHGLCTPEQVARAAPEGARWFKSKWAAYGRLKAMEELKLIERHRTWWQGPRAVMATKSGTRMAGVDLPPSRLSLPELGHSVAVVDLSELLLIEHPGSRWETERELRRDALRSQREEGMTTRQVFRPRTADGALVRPGAKRVAVELDLTPKRTQTYEQILAAYATAPGVGAVWWFTPHPTLRDRIARTVAQMGMGTFVEVHDFAPITDLPEAFGGP